MLSNLQNLNTEIYYCNKIKFFANHSVDSLIAGAQYRNVSGQGSLMELRHFDNYFFKNTREKGSAGKKIGFFTPRYP